MSHGTFVVPHFDEPSMVMVPHHLSGREGIRCSLPMAWSIVKRKETSCGAICFSFKDVGHKIHLLYEIVGGEIAITILASSKEHMGFTKNHLTVFY